MSSRLSGSIGRWRFALATVAAVVAVLAVVMLAGRGHRSWTPLVDLSDARLLADPAGALLFDPVWVPARKRLVVARDPGPPARGAQLYEMSLNGQERRLRIPGDPDCTFTGSTFPVLLRAGLIAYLRECYGNLDRLPAHFASIYSYDTISGKNSRLRPYDFRTFTKRFTLSPDGQRGLINDGFGLEEQLRWLDKDKTRKLALPVLRAGTPRMAPTGNAVVFDAVPTGSDAVGVDRLDLPRSIFLFNTRTRELKTLLTGVHAVWPAGWSPNGRWLAIAIQPADGPNGLWLLDTRSRDRRLVFRGEHLTGVTWIDDSHLAVSTGQFSFEGKKTNGPIGLYIVTLPPLS